MNDDPAQSSNNSYGGGISNQNQPGQTNQTPQQQSSSSPHSVTPQPSSQPVSHLPHKEQEPITEHVHVSDAAEIAPQLHQELKEYGVEARKDEAHLELTREQKNQGMTHSPSSQPVKPVVTDDQKPEFPMNYQTAEEESKKSSVWSSLRWLATYVLRQMKIKKLAEETAK